jgi:hypothetical protein
VPVCTIQDIFSFLIVYPVLNDTIKANLISTLSPLILEGDSEVKEIHLNSHRKRGLYKQERFGDNI